MQRINKTKADLIQELQSKTFAIACSGGIDSMVLMHLCQSTMGNSFYCLHLDHNWREDSILAKEFIENYCKTHSIKFISKKLDQIRISEDEGRKARYEFFEEICEANSIDYLLMGHNLNDKIETVLFRITRGTNIHGLKSIAEFRDLNNQCKIYRPLLNLSRDEIEDYARQHSLEYKEDTSNSDIKFARNRIRHNVIPELLQINTKLLNNVDKLSRLAEEQDNFINSVAQKELERLGDFPWQIQEFRQLNCAIQRKILELRFIENIDFVTSFINSIQEGGFHRINFAKNKFFTIKQKQIWLENDIKE